MIQSPPRLKSKLISVFRATALRSAQAYIRGYNRIRDPLLSRSKGSGSFGVGVQVEKLRDAAQHASLHPSHPFDMGSPCAKLRALRLYDL